MQDESAALRAEIQSETMALELTSETLAKIQDQLEEVGSEGPEPVTVTKHDKMPFPSKRLSTSPWQQTGEMDHFFLVLGDKLCWLALMLNIQF